MLCDCDLFLKPPENWSLIMSNSHFAQHAYGTEYPASSRAAQGEDHFATACTLDLDLRAGSTTELADGGKLRCAPGVDQQMHVFHWLVFAAPSPEGKDAKAGCDLWRWHRGEWRSVFVAGAIFSPEEMYSQGWRYCAPSVQLFVKIVSAAKEGHGGAGRVEVLPKHPAGSGSAAVPPKRNRPLTLAVQAPMPAWPRPSGPLRRAVSGSV